MDSLKVTDELSKSVQKTPNRVALDDIESAIAAEFTINAGQTLWSVQGNPDLVTPIPSSLRVLTICILVMKNGFTVIGKSAPADEQNYNEEIGRKFAREDAIRQLWPLMGFALRDKLMAA